MRNTAEGTFITLEGIEGVGKSTCLKFIDKYLRKQGVPAIVTREPGGTAVAEKIREVLLHKHAETITAETELLLLFAARSQHLTQIIKPALMAGKWVICDRFTDASYAYQGGGRGMSMERIATLEKWIQGNFHPHLTLVLDAPVRVALHRVHRRKHADRIESEEARFFQKVRRVYLELAKKDERRYKIVPTNKPLSLVKEQIKKVLEPFIAHFHSSHTNVTAKK